MGGLIDKHSKTNKKKPRPEKISLIIYLLNSNAKQNKTKCESFDVWNKPWIHESNFGFVSAWTIQNTNI